MPEDANETKHTPGTMLVDGLTLYILDEEESVNRITCPVYGGAPSNRPTHEELKANARRMAACWNACAGISTDLLDAISRIEHPLTRLATFGVAIDAVGEGALEEVAKSQGLDAAHRAVSAATHCANQIIAKAQPK